MKLFDREVARQTLIDVYPILSPYFALAHGTVLGAYRDKDFTPTEVDIDLLTTVEVMAENAELLLIALEREGFVSRVIEKPNGAIRAFSVKRNGIKIDCAGYTKHILKSSQEYNTSLHSLINSRPRCLSAYREVGYSTSTLKDFSIVHPYSFFLRENMETIDFQGLPWKIPSPIEEYLEREYGSEWETPIRTHMQQSRIYHFETLEGIS